MLSDLLTVYFVGFACALYQQWPKRRNWLAIIAALLTAVFWPIVLVVAILLVWYLTRKS